MMQALQELKIDLKKSLKDIFGYGQFRGNQEVIINNLLAGKDTFVIMPTGAGKSLCYQLPALLVKGTAVVISPLIALMKNQVDQLQALGVRAEFLNSTLSRSESTRVKRETIEGKVKLLYVAPESLTKEDNIAFLQEANISFTAIDEAHCISEWGHDFRPEYRRIRSILDQLGKMPIIALTATATPKVQQDIQKNLSMEATSVFKSSFNRPNLFYEVKPKTKDNDLEFIKFIKRFKNKAGIVYCLTRKKVESVAKLLQANDVKALPYHAGLEAATRIKNQDAFLNEDTDVVVATIAFGMGIDKPDVRFVVHYDTPKSIEGYYQETGRSGRDGLEGHCLMFYNHADIVKLEKFNKDKPVAERDNARHLLQEMASYSESLVCRRVQLLNYFGEHFAQNECKGMCDNCKRPQDKRFEAKEKVQIALKAVLQTQQNFDAKHLAAVICGLDNQYINSYNHNSLEVYGKGKEESVLFWETLIRQVLLANFLERDIDRLSIFKITQKGRDFIDKPYSVLFYRDDAYNERVQAAELAATEVAPKNSYDEVLFDLLKNLRKKVGKKHNLRPYVIFQEPSLEEMAILFPTNLDELSQINGVGKGKARKFGKEFWETIKEYVEKNDIETAFQIQVKSTVQKSKMKIFIIQHIDRQVGLEEIAEAQKVRLEVIIAEIEHICYSGTKLNLDYYIDDILDDERQDEIIDYFREAPTDNIHDALEEFDDEYSEDELRLMRVKFLSEYAM
jgi:ATP-dependent DNA helicase RecQ